MLLFEFLYLKLKDIVSWMNLLLIPKLIQWIDSVYLLNMPEDKTSIYNSIAWDCVYESKLEFLKLNRFLFELTL